MTDEPPRIGVYVCDCGFNILGVVDVPEVVRYATTLDGVVVSKEYKYMCSDPGQDLIKTDVREQRLNRVVVASCTPTLHERTFRRVVSDAGLNPFLFHMVNIREGVSWVTEDRTKATEKAKALLRAGVRRVTLQEPLEARSEPVCPNVLVIGGGIAGMHAALSLANANAGAKVHLVEREPSIGGNMARFDKTFPTLDCASCILTPKMTEVKIHPNIHLHSYAEVVSVEASCSEALCARTRERPLICSLARATSAASCPNRRMVRSRFETSSSMAAMATRAETPEDWSTRSLSRAAIEISSMRCRTAPGTTTSGPPSRSTHASCAVICAASSADGG